VVCREETLLRDSFVIATAARPPLFRLVHVEGFQIRVQEVVHRVGRRGAMREVVVHRGQH
jgi:hypothetical protein